jgi:uncharacterized protein YxjI
MLRRQERRDERQIIGRRGDVAHYQMRQKLGSIGDDFYIENDRGQRVFIVDGEALRIRKAILFEDMHGNELCKVQTRMLSVRDTIEIEGPAGQTLATVKKVMIAPLRERWSVDVPGGQEMEILGNIVDHEYAIEVGGRRVAEISKRWFHLVDTYGVEIAPGQSEVLMLAITTAVDMMASS